MRRRLWMQPNYYLPSHFCFPWDNTGASNSRQVLPFRRDYLPTLYIVNDYYYIPTPKSCVGPCRRHDHACHRHNRANLPRVTANPASPPFLPGNGLPPSSSPRPHVAWAMLLAGFMRRACRDWILAGRVLPKVCIGEAYRVSLKKPGWVAKSSKYEITSPIRELPPEVGNNAVSDALRPGKKWQNN